MNDAPARRDWQTIVLIAFRVVVVIAVAAEVPDFANTASDRYREIARAEGTPYRDFPVEYAPGELLLALLVGSSTPAFAVAGLAIAAFLADVITWWALVRGWGRSTARRYLWLGTPLLVFIYRRADLVAIALAVVGMLLVRRDRDRWGGGVFAVAVLTRFWPVVLAPIWLVQRRWSAARTFAIALLAGSLSWIAIAGPDAIRQVATFRRATGFELESSVGAVVWALTGEHRLEFDANRTGVIPSWFSPAMSLVLALLLAMIWLRSANRPRVDPSGAPAVAAIAALLIVSPVFSPQYISWLVPWAAIAGRDSPRWPIAVAFPVVVTSFLAMGWAVGLGLGPGRTQALLIARNASVLAMLVGYFFWMQRERAMVGREPVLEELPEATARR